MKKSSAKSSSKHTAAWEKPASLRWTFLSNHAHVLFCLALDPEIRVREVALKVGITERAVSRILTELEEVGAISKKKVGRRNQYRIQPSLRLRHPLEAHADVGTLLGLLESPEEAS